MNEEVLRTQENRLPGSMPGGVVQQNLQQNLHQTQQTNNVFVNQNVAQTSVVPGNFAALLKAVPVKLENITKLLNDGSNFDIWDADIREFLGMIPEAVIYLKEEALPMEGWSESMANGVNGVIHWTVDRQLGMRLRKYSPYPSARMIYLRNLYSGETFANLLSLFQQLKSAMYDPSSVTLDIHISKMSELRRRLEKSGMTLTNDVFGAFLAVGTPSGFPDIAQTFEPALLADPKAIISTAKITRALGLADISFKRQNPTSSDALVVTASGSDGKKDLKCRYCKKKGHFQIDCRKKKKDEEDKKTPTTREVDAGKIKAADVDIGFAGCVTLQHIDVFQVGTNVLRWTVIFDTGATHHVFNNRRYFTHLRQIKPIPIRMANGPSTSVITAVGTAMICNVMNESETLLVKNVYFCESLSHSLLSGIQLREDGVHFRTTNSGVDFLSYGAKVMFAPLMERRWVLRAVERKVELSAMMGDFMLWHRRMGHPNDNVLLKLIRDGVCVGAPEKLKKSVPCEECAVAKSTKTPTIGSSMVTYDGPLQLVVADLCGPFPTKTISGCEYSLEIRDVWSTFMKTYLLKAKSEAGPLIKSYVAEAERLTGKKVIRWRTDNGGEFINNMMATFFTQSGITFQNSLPFFHEQNGTIERANRTVQSIMRVLLCDSKLPRGFWGMALTAGTFLHNRTPNSNTRSRTPQELFLGSKPQVDHLRIFGSWAFLHVPSERRKKLDDRARKMRFVGYLGGVKGWRFWDPVKNDFMESEHARWLDEKGMKDLRDQGLEKTGQSSIDKLLNSISISGLDGEVKDLIETLSMEYRIEDPYSTTTIRDQDEVIKKVQALSAGLAGRLPRSYQEAISGDHGEEWLAGCKKEIDTLVGLGVWDEVRLPDGQHAVSSKWVFAEQTNTEGQVVKRKLRLVVRGFTQKEGVDFTDTFAPTAKFTSLMIIITIAVRNGWTLKGFDVVSAYPHSPIDETIYVKPPEGFKTRIPGTVFLLRKALYGTKQAARCWWNFFSSVLKGIGCKYCINDQSLYVLQYKNKTALLWIHVDDGAVCSSLEIIIGFVRESLLKFFDITWTEKLEQIVGIRIQYTARGIFLSQPTLTSSLIESTGFVSSRAATPMNANLHLDSSNKAIDGINQTSYLSIIGSLSYLALGTRPDIAYSVNYLARFSSRPNAAHWVALKHLLRYVSGTKTEGIWFEKKMEQESLIAYCDANWGGEFSRSTHGFIFFLYGNPISWASRRQSCVATSTCHAEYMALGVTGREAIWIQNLLMDIFGQGFKTIINCNVTAAIKVANDLHLTKRSHHVAREFHYVNEQVHDDNLAIRWIDSPRQLADIMTKALAHVLFSGMKRAIGVIDGGSSSRS